MIAAGLMPDRRFLAVRGAGHLVLVAQPEVVTKAITDVITRVGCRT